MRPFIIIAMICGCSTANATALDRWCAPLNSLATPKYQTTPLSAEYVGEDQGKSLYYGPTKIVPYLRTDSERKSFLLGVTPNGLLTINGEIAHTLGQVDIYAMNGEGVTLVLPPSHPGNHSTPWAGLPLAAAGQITIRNGLLHKVDNSSGHYAPPPESLVQLLAELKNRKADLSHTRVVFYLPRELTSLQRSAYLTELDSRLQPFGVQGWDWR